MLVCTLYNPYSCDSCKRKFYSKKKLLRLTHNKYKENVNGCASSMCAAAITAINWCKIVFLILFKNTYYSTRNYTHLFHVIDMYLLTFSLSISLHPIDTVTISVLLVLLKIYLFVAINRTNMLLTPNNDHVNCVLMFTSLFISYDDVANC